MRNYKDERNKLARSPFVYAFFISQARKESEAAARLDVATPKPATTTPTPPPATEDAGSSMESSPGM